jgi:hypothetical protein
LIARKARLVFDIYMDSVSIGRMTSLYKELMQDERVFKVYEVNRRASLRVEDSIREYELFEWYRTSDDGRPLSFEHKRAWDEDTVRITGACEGHTCRMIVDDQEERTVEIDETVRFRVPFERWAFRDKLRVGTRFQVRLLRVEKQEVVPVDVQISALDTLEVGGKVLELYRAEVLGPEGNQIETLWVDHFGDLWRAETRIQGFWVTMERSERS